MKKSALFFLGLTLVSFIIPLLTGEAYAGDLGTLVRLDRTAISHSTGGLVCATPQSSGVETQMQIVFPTGFTVNQTASNWTVTTLNLPSGAVAMPGITTATTVSGQIVTFPINDLSTGTEYCFNFSSTNTLTTPSSTGTYVGIVRTLNASNNVIDYHAYGISIVTNDSISVTATVAANPTDFSADLSLTDPVNATFPQNTTLTYTLTYGNLLTYPADITVEAAWDLGTVQGGATPTVDLLDYVVGSATNGYNSSPPVVDSVNRKIDWTISAIPGSTTDQTVSFKLKTNASYTGTLPVTFTVNGRTYGPGTVTADSTVNSTYQYSTPVTPTPTPGSTSSSSSSSSTATSATSTPTPTPTQAPSPTKAPVINDIQLRTVSSSEAAILVVTDKNTTAKIQYGTSLKALSKTAASKTLSTEHIIQLTALSPATRYYYKVTVVDKDGKNTVSDFYVIDTALPSTPPQILANSLILTSNDVVLTDPLRESATVPLIVIPANTPYSFKFSVANYNKIKSIKAIVRNNNVLGLTSFRAYASSDFVEITEIAPGQYIGKLQTEKQPGTYHLVIQLQDFNGNISEQTLSAIHITRPFTIVNAITQEPIEKAKVNLSFFNVRLKTYDALSSDITPVKNPNYSETDGTVPIVLPSGKYRAMVTALGYEDASVDFEIGSQASNYPIVALKPLPFSVTSYIRYTTSTASDVFSLLRDYIHTLRTSIRFFDLIAFLVVFLLVFLGAVSYARKLSVPLSKLPYFGLYFLESLIKKQHHSFPVHGKVLNGEVVVGGASIYLSLPNGRVIAHTTTNSDGEFFANIHEGSNIKVTFTKKGFKSITQSISKDALDSKIELRVTRIEKPATFGFETIFWYTSYIIGALFEAILILTLLTELLFILEFGVWKVLPFVVVSFANIFLWAANARATRS